MIEEVPLFVGPVRLLAEEDPAGASRASARSNARAEQASAE